MRAITTLNELADPKDIKRIKDLFIRANDNEEKALKLAQNMANSIKDVEKAFRRAEAAWEVLGTTDNKIAQVFIQKYNELGGISSRLPDEIIDEASVLGSMMPFSKQYKGKRGYAGSILPVNRINLTTGKNAWFNVYNTWADSTFEVWRVNNSTTEKFRLIATAGDTPTCQIGQNQDFYHDQNSKFFGNWELIDYIKVKYAKHLIPYYGNSIPGYTYK